MITNEAWANVQLPITVTRGDLLVGQSQDNVQTLPIGTLNQVLMVGANGRPGWSAAPTLTSLSPDGSAASPTLVFATETASGRYRINNNNFGESINSAEVFEWNATRILWAKGYQTIYQGASSGAVTVQAQSTAGTWTFQWPNSVGSANQVLTTDGVSGIMSWTAGGGAPFTDASALVKNAADTSKLAIFSAASIATATTRTYTLPNVNGTLITTADSGTVTNTMLANSGITIQGSSVALGGSTLATTATPQFARLGLNQAADGTASLAATQTALGTTSTDGFILQNTTAAAAGAQQVSPRMHWSGQGWKTNATAASQTVDWAGEVLPVQGAAQPGTLLRFMAQVNAGGFGGTGASVLFFWDGTGSKSASMCLGAQNPDSSGITLPGSQGGFINFYNVNAYIGRDDSVASAALIYHATASRFDHKFSLYNNVATAGWGVSPTYGYGRATAQAAAVASVATYTCGAADGSFDVSANVNVTASTTHSFNVNVTYTDETNTSRTVNLVFINPAANSGTLQLIANGGGVAAYSSFVTAIRVKASTAITILTSGTFTTVTYNVEGFIKQTA